MLADQLHGQKFQLPTRLGGHAGLWRAVGPQSRPHPAAPRLLKLRVRPLATAIPFFRQRRPERRRPLRPTSSPRQATLMARPCMGLTSGRRSSLTSPLAKTWQMRLSFSSILVTPDASRPAGHPRPYRLVLLVAAQTTS